MWGLAALTALMTAFYMTRLLWLTFFGASRMSHEVEHHVHESPLSMTGVLGVLAVLSVVGGYIGVPHFLEPQLPLPQVVPALEHYEHTLLYVSVALAFGGVGLAVFLYSGPASRPESIARTFAPLHALLSGKYFVDELYDRALGRPLVWISENVLLKGGDRMLLDGTLNGLGAMAHRTAALFARVQTGSLHLYGLMVVVGLVGVVLWSWRHV